MKLKNYLLILTTLCIAFYSCKVEEEEPEPEKTLTLLPFRDDLLRFWHHDSDPQG